MAVGKTENAAGIVCCASDEHGLFGLPSLGYAISASEGALGSCAESYVPRYMSVQCCCLLACSAFVSHMLTAKQQDRCNNSQSDATACCVICISAIWPVLTCACL